MLPLNSDQTNLSADVAPFVPRREFQNEAGYPEQAPLPRYLTTCYPFVQEQQDGRISMQPSNNSHINPANYFGTSTAGPPAAVSPHRQFILGMMPPSAGFVGPSVSASMVYDDLFHQRGGNYPPVTNVQKHRQSGRKVMYKNVGIQKEVGSNTTNNTDHPVRMVDSCQQTDFPLSIASKSLTDRPSPLKKSSRNRRHVMVNEDDPYSSSDHADADVDSDSGYYSPKHRVHKRSGGTSTAELTSGHGSSRHQRSSEQPPIPRLVYLTPSPTLYQVQQHVGHTVMPSVLSPHPTPPPPMLLTPPPTPILDQTSVNRGRPPPGFPPPPNFYKPQVQFPGALVWNVRPQFSGYNPNQRLPAPNPHFHPHNQPIGYPGQQRTRHQMASQKYRRQGHSPQSSPGNFSYEMRSFDKRKQDKRKGPYKDILDQERDTAIKNGVPLQETPLFLSDSQEFPGLGGPSNSNQAVITNAAFSYSDAVLGKTNTQNEAQAMHDKAMAQKNRKRQKKAERASKAADEEYAEISKEQEDIKKALKKTAANRNRSKTAMLDLGEIVSRLESAPEKESTPTGSKSPHKKLDYDASQSSPLPSARARPGTGILVNQLDSTAPMVKRGKEREVPKLKKPSALKKVILKEREEKKEHRLNQLTSCDLPDTDVPPYPPALLDTLKSKTEEEEFDASSLMESIPPSVPQIHSRRYREYCSQVLDKSIDEICTTILQKLVQFQDRMYVKDPVKAKMKRRLVMGIREVTKHLKLKRLKCVIVSPNLEKIQSKGGLDDALQQILNMCEVQNVTYVFALGRRAMGRAVSKLVPVSIVGIFDYSGAEDHYKQMCDLVVEAQNKYQEMVSIYQQEVIDATTSNTPQPTAAPAGATKRFAHMGHSRNPSAASCVSFASFISEPISEMNEGSNWRAMMDAGEEQAPLSPPPEVESSADEDPEPPKNSTGGGGQGAAVSHEELSRKDSGSTVVEVKEQVARDIRHEPLEEEEDGNFSAHDLSSDVSSTNLDVSTTPGVLDKSFSNCSTVVGPLVSARSDATPPRSSDKSHPSAKDPAPEGPSSLFETIAEESGQDRIHLWLETASQSVQDLHLEDPLDRDEEADDTGNLQPKEDVEEEEATEEAKV